MKKKASQSSGGVGGCLSVESRRELCCKMSTESFGCAGSICSSNRPLPPTLSSIVAPPPLSSSAPPPSPFLSSFPLLRSARFLPQSHVRPRRSVSCFPQSRNASLASSLTVSHPPASDPTPADSATSPVAAAPSSPLASPSGEDAPDAQEGEGVDSLTLRALVSTKEAGVIIGSSLAPFTPQPPCSCSAFLALRSTAD